MIIKAPNVNQAFVDGLWWLKTAGVLEKSRNGPVLVSPGPVMTEYSRPMERVLMEPRRDANPVFHLLEAIWMLAGVKHSGFLLPFNSNMKSYAEDDGNIHGAYGHRWRNHFELDQIQAVIDQLCAKSDSRQAVIAMWDPRTDLNKKKRDLPCNTHIYFDCRGGKLNMTVCCRSNDMLWGAYGANVVHFSILQEIISAGVGAPVGVYRQFSNNFHIYTEVEMVKELLSCPPVAEDPYHDVRFKPLPLVWGDEQWYDFITDCTTMVVGTRLPYKTKFMRDVAAPLKDAYILRRSKMKVDISDMPDCDWKAAFAAWAKRREV